MKYIRQILKSNQGHTFAEVLVASTILLLSVLAVSGLLLQGYRIMNAAGKRTLTLHLAQEEMEGAITNPGAGPDSEDVVIHRDHHNMNLFGEIVEGTLVTVRKNYTGGMSGEVTYTYFIPGGEN